MAVLRTKYIVYMDSGFDRVEVSSHWSLKRAKESAQRQADKSGSGTAIDVDEGYQTGEGWQVEFSDPDQYEFFPQTAL